MCGPVVVVSPPLVLRLPFRMSHWEAEKIGSGALLVLKPM